MVTFFIQEVYRISGIGVVPVGKIESGVLRLGMTARLTGGIFKVTRIEKDRKQQETANQGDTVGLSFAFTSTEQFERGFFARLFGGRDAGFSVLKNYRGKRIEFL